LWLRLLCEAGTTWAGPEPEGDEEGEELQQYELFDEGTAEEGEEDAEEDGVWDWCCTWWGAELE
jgi:hypothetical protein